ncbi:MAG: sigma-70 family RNA polymerase sigma factor [Bacilli bacterium]|jgi:RNA polymerase sporulation-specific sigma factor|nr:sigma-70 family RNA polymerase sigma factor [Bacilli bacterium]
MNYDDYSDSELYSLVCESNEDAKDLLFQKYKYIIDVVIKNYSFTALKYGFEYKDLYQEALVGFSDALQSYQEDKNASLPTFITLCVDRRLQNILRNASRFKNMAFKDSLSLDHVYEETDLPLRDLISDHSSNDPLLNITKDEDYLELTKIIEKLLSKGEYEVYKLMVCGFNYSDIAKLLDKSNKQIDNTIQRVKGKIKEILKKRKTD